MLSFRRGSAFWVLLIVAAFLPATLLATKQVHKADIKDSGGKGVGSAVINIRNGQYTYMSRTFARPGQTVTFVELTPTDASWSIVLCNSLNGPAEDDCTYDSSGNLDIEGSITPTHLIVAGVTASQFFDTLSAGQLTIRLNDGSSGAFYRII
jgi:hypothetical protein